MSQDEIARVLSEYKERKDLADVAKRMNIPYSSLARILNEHDNYDLGVKKLIAFIEATDYDFTLLDHIETRLGRAAVEIKTAENACDFERLSKLTHETGEALQVISDALADGVITKKEASNCIKEVMHVIQVAMGIIQELKRIEEESE